ncbi:ABC transporter substrate-binding protein [Salinicoccus hispanicus]|uniref:ABC transporter substrate-binding protein n=1 Tax=Salinicoccus hispanicus TaxID=157225 RepID=A0A6N8U032_9STAP|nr:ABC transporter substrate-binding protein [Salinicoccus hispanicus]MXQ51420.1 ABC transporter substrate-binding protein [Salinicoccus hispanicus]
MNNRFGAFLLSLLFILAGCNSVEEGVENTPLENQRIVSLIPSNTEIAVEMGLEHNLVAVTTEDDYPESIVDNTDLVRLNAFELDEETLVSLEPTHILAHESAGSVYGDILDRVSEATEAEVLVVDDAQSIEGIYRSITDIGEFLNEKTSAERLNESIERDINIQSSIFEDRGESIDAFIHISPQPELYTAGGNTFIADALSEIYINNTFEDLEGYPAVSAEDVVRHNPDKVISIMGMEDAALEESIENTPGFSELAISEPENQCNISPELLSRPGPRIAEGLKAVGRCIYE